MVKPAAPAAVNCAWCWPKPRIPRKANSDWEQKNLSGEWKRLCNRCASSRLNNPWNAQLPMRRIKTVTRG